MSARVTARGLMVGGVNVLDGSGGGLLVGEEGCSVVEGLEGFGWRIWKRWGISLEMLRLGVVEMLEGRVEEIAVRDS